MSKSEVTDYMKKPCAHCPFRRDVRPYLRPERAVDIAHSALNPYSDFSCHKTTESDEESGERYATNASKTCAGFLTMRASYDNAEVPNGFTPAWGICYTDTWEMEECYSDSEIWEGQLPYVTGD